MTQAGQLLFGAVLAQVALTVVLYLALVRARFSVPKSELRAEMAYDQAAWPVKARLIANSVTSQFELPVLFYAGALFAFVLAAPDMPLAILAWLFVVARIVHAAIHTGKNVVMQRFAVFLVGFVSLAVFWILLAIKVLGG